MEPYATPARVQSAVVLDALRRQKPLMEVMQLINSVTSRTAISNEIIKNQNILKSLFISCWFIVSFSKLQGFIVGCAGPIYLYTY